MSEIREGSAKQIIISRGLKAPFRNVLGEKLPGEASHADVHDLVKEIHGRKYVVKTGKTEYVPPLIKMLPIRVPRKLASSFVVNIYGEDKFDFSLTEKSIIRAYNEDYGLIKRYFGPESGQARGDMLVSMGNPENTFYQEMAKIPGIKKEIPLVREVLKRHLNDDFLKHELPVFIGLPLEISEEKVNKLIAEGKSLPVTYYILQEKVSGDRVLPLADIKDDDLRQRVDLTEKLLTFCILQKKMDFDTGRIIDTKAEWFVGKNWYEWFQKTRNILVDMENNQPYFVDTRFLWSKGKRRFLVPLPYVLTKRSVNRAIKKYVKILMDTSSQNTQAQISTP